MTAQLNRRRYGLSALALTSLLAAGCGTGTITRNNSSGTQSSGDATAAPQSDSATSTPLDSLMTPPRGYYDALFSGTLNNLGKSLALADQSAVLWVNFDGAKIAKGFGPGQSFLLCNASAQLAPSTLAPSERETVIAAVQQFYDDAGAKLTVTATMPTSGNYTTIDIGNAYSDLGCSGGGGVLGVAPFDEGNANPNDIGFVFAGGVSDLKTLAVGIAHEAGHTFGLDHVTNNADVMAPVAHPDATGFTVSQVLGTQRTQDAPALLRQALGGDANQTPASSGSVNATIPGLGNLPTGLAGLPGLGQLAGIGSLLPGLAGANTLDISQLLPALQGLLPVLAAGSGLPGLDKILTIVALASQAGAAQQGSATALPSGAINSQLAASLLNLQNLSGGLDLSKLLQLGGFGNLGTALPSLQGLLGGLLGNLTGAAPATTAATSATPQIPDLSALLGLPAANTDFATLLQNLLGSAQVVSANYSGADQTALLSLLKVAYAQQYLNVLGNAP